MFTPVKHTENHVKKTAAKSAQFFDNSDSVSFFKAKLTVDQIGDAHEQEADHVADQVMRMREGDVPIVQRMSFSPWNGVMRKCTDCEEQEKEDVQRKETNDGDTNGKLTPSNVVNDSGQPMEGSTRQFMESRFGQDFSSVRIHVGSQAAESAAAIHARAYTSGRNVVFGAGEYQPGSESGKKLLAHELTHVGQQAQNNSNSISKSSIKIQKKMTLSEFAEANPHDDERSFYINGTSKYNKIKQILTKSDILFEGNPTPDNIVKKKPPGGQLTEFYLGKVSTTSATDKNIIKLLDSIVGKGGEVFITTDEFVNKIQTLLDAFKNLKPNSFSTLQVINVLEQKAIEVNGEASCIETMNKCIENIYGTNTLKKEDLSDTAFGTIEKLQNKKLSLPPQKVILDYVGTGRFQIRPENILKVTKFRFNSFAETLIETTKDKEDGFYINACSLFNGYHSIIVIIKKEKGKYRFTWKDQDHKVEYDSENLNNIFYDYAAGRYSWRIRERYKTEYNRNHVPESYDAIKNKSRTLKIEQLEKANIIDDLQKTIVAPLISK